MVFVPRSGLLRFQDCQHMKATAPVDHSFMPTFFILLLLLLLLDCCC
jgi:hypothetical protein